MDVEIVEVVERHPPCGLRFGLLRVERTTDGVAAKAQTELLAHFSVVRHDVPRVGIDADEPIYLDLDPCLFLSFAGGGLRRALAQIESAAGNCPQIVIALVIIRSAPTSTTTAVTDGTRLLAAGAALSFK